MKISKMITELEAIKEEYGDIEVVGYDYSARNHNLVDSKIEDDGIQVFFDPVTKEDYVEIGFWPFGEEAPITITSADIANELGSGVAKAVEKVLVNKVLNTKNN